MAQDDSEAQLLNRRNFLGETGATGSTETPPQHGDTIPWQKDLLVLFLRNQLRVAPAMPILALLLAITSLQWNPMSLSIGWFFAALGCQAVQWYRARIYF